MIFNLFQKLESYTCKVMSSHLLIKAKAPQSILYEASLIAHDIEKKLSAYNKDSEISAINTMAGIQSVRCSDDTIEVLHIALEIAKASEGIYDPSIGVLTQKGYGFGTNKEKLLSSSEKKYLKSFVDYKKISIKGNEVYLEKKGMALDLGGIGKGFACDKIIAFLQAKKVKTALVSVGGEICTYAKAWSVGVQHPREHRLLAQITTKKEQTYITSSGDYERYIKDTSHHHIIEPKSAKSANLYSSLTLVSTSVNAAKMDALNTALYQMNEADSTKLLEAFDVATLHVSKSLHVRESQNIYTKLRSLQIL